MSADNFYLVRRAGDRYAVSMEFASSEEDAETNPVARLDFPKPIDDVRLEWFDTRSDALSYAGGEYAEYGVTDQSVEDSSYDTAAHRLATVARELAERYETVGGSNNPDGSVTVYISGFAVHVTGSSTHAEVRELASWIEATSPASVAERFASHETVTA